jgi:hypothetical protein
MDSMLGWFSRNKPANAAAAVKSLGAAVVGKYQETNGKWRPLTG